MKNLLKVSAAAIALNLSQVSLAAPINLGEYDVRNASNNHGLWLNSRVSHEGVENNNNYFSLQSSTFSVFENEGDYFANLTGSVYDEDLQGGFTFSVDMAYRCSGVVACGLDYQLTGNVADTVDQEQWDFYDFVDNDIAGAETVLIGTGSLAGMTVGISQRPTDGSKPFRFGTGADWYNINLLGGSGWFNINYVDGTPDDVIFKAKRGDFNVRKVAEPGTLALLSIGLIALGIRRKQQ